jgi:hypothetical protein
MANRESLGVFGKICRAHHRRRGGRSRGSPAWARLASFAAEITHAAAQGRRNRNHRGRNRRGAEGVESNNRHDGLHSPPRPPRPPAPPAIVSENRTIAGKTTRQAAGCSSVSSRRMCGGDCCAQQRAATEFQNNGVAGELGFEPRLTESESAVGFRNHKPIFPTGGEPGLIVSIGYARFPNCQALRQSRRSPARCRPAPAGDSSVSMKRAS